jgi:hypothetical protein
MQKQLITYEITYEELLEFLLCHDLDYAYSYKYSSKLSVFYQYYDSIIFNEKVSLSIDGMARQYFVVFKDREIKHSIMYRKPDWLFLLTANIDRKTYAKIRIRDILPFLEEPPLCQRNL